MKYNIYKQEERLGIIMIKIISLLLTMTMVLALGACGTKTEVNDSTDNGKLVIGYTIYEPMNYMENGKLTGFDTEFAEAVCKKLNMTPEFVEINWDTKFVTLNANNID